MVCNPESTKKNQAFETFVAAKAHRFCCTAQKSRLIAVPSFYSLFARLEYLVFQEDEGNMQEVRVFSNSNAFQSNQDPWMPLDHAAFVTATLTR